MKTLPKTDIEYLTHHWPVVTGCSFGCPWCWARATAARFPQTHAEKLCGIAVPRRFSAPFTHPDRLDLPLRRKKPARIGVCFTGDLFGPEVSNDFNRRVYRTMAKSPHHAFFLLTKRAQIMNDVARDYRDLAQSPNVFHGVTVTTKAEADERIPLLLATPAARRWVSIEPMLGPIDLERCAAMNDGKASLDFYVVGSIDRPSAQFPAPKREWIESIREQCKSAGVPLWEKNNLVRHGVVKDRPLVQELPA